MIYEMGLKFDKLMETLFGLEVPEYPIFPPTISGRHWRTFAEYVERNATHPDRGDPSAMLLRHDISGLTKHEAREMNW